VPSRSALPPLSQVWQHGVTHAPDMVDVIAHASALVALDVKVAPIANVDLTQRARASREARGLGCIGHAEEGADRLGRVGGAGCADARVGQREELLSSDGGFGDARVLL